MDELLSLLSKGDLTSGETLCQNLNMTRAAIWKRIEKLRKEGYAIESLAGRGYKLNTPLNSLLPAYIQMNLKTNWAGKGTILYEQTTPSTNTRLKELARNGAPRGSISLCELQTQGKGRLGRTWEANSGENLMHSLLLCPNLSLEQSPLCTLAAATAMAQAIEDVLPILNAGIKWPNDIVMNGRKCVGILSELAADMDGIHFIVMGVGVNVNQTAFAGDIADSATSLLLEQRKQIGEKNCPPIDRRQLLCAYLSRMEQAITKLEEDGLSALLPEYTRRSVTLGAEVRVISTNDEWRGTAESIDDTGALKVRDASGTLRRVLSGDVSVRGVMGYA